MRPSDYFEDEEDVLDFDLLEKLRARPVAEYTDVEAAIALAELLAQEFLLYGTNGEHHIDRRRERRNGLTRGIPSDDVELGAPPMPSAVAVDAAPAPG